MLNYFCGQSKVRRMDLWIKEVMGRLNRNKVQILFSEHAAKDKNLDIEELITP